MIKDNLHDITNWIDHNRGQFFGVIISVLIVVSLFGVFGCSKTQSLNDPTAKVNREMFSIECLTTQQTLEENTIDIQAELKKHNTRIEVYNQRKQAGLDDLQKQDALKQEVLEIASGAIAQYASGGSISLAPLIMSVFNLAGVGWGIGNKLDNLRKDKVITEQKQTT